MLRASHMAMAGKRPGDPDVDVDVDVYESGSSTSTSTSTSTLIALRASRLARSPVDGA